MTNKYLKLITSPRFIQLFFVGVSAGLLAYQSTGSWITGVCAAIGIWFGSSTLVGTFDRKQDKLVEAAKVNATVATVTIPKNTKTVTASKKK